jgi:branched-chain amino acid transport system permease protein
MVAVQIALSAVTLAAVYALVNVGFVLLYRTTGVINFAQGQFMAIGAYLMATVAARWSYWPSLLVAAVVVAALGVIVYGLVMRFLVGREEFTKVIATLLLSFILVQVITVVWGTQTRILQPPSTVGFEIAGANISLNSLLAIAFAGASIGALVVFLGRTVTGTRMQAVAQDEVLAMYRGIRLHWLAALAWGLAGASAGLAGIVYAQTASVSPELALIGLSAFPAAVIGGFNSFIGTIAGGLVVATVQSVTGYYTNAVWGNVATWVLMLVILLAVPSGFFGRAVARRI